MATISEFTNLSQQEFEKLSPSDKNAFYASYLDSVSKAGVTTLNVNGGNDQKVLVSKTKPKSSNRYRIVADNSASQDTPLAFVLGDGVRVFDGAQYEVQNSSGLLIPTTYGFTGSNKIYGDKTGIFLQQSFHTAPVVISKIEFKLIKGPDDYKPYGFFDYWQFKNNERPSHPTECPWKYPDGQQNDKISFYGTYMDSNLYMDGKCAIVFVVQPGNIAEFYITESLVQDAFAGSAEK